MCFSLHSSYPVKRDGHDGVLAAQTEHIGLKTGMGHAVNPYSITMAYNDISQESG